MAIYISLKNPSKFHRLHFPIIHKYHLEDLEDFCKNLNITNKLPKSDYIKIEDEIDYVKIIKFVNYDIEILSQSRSFEFLKFILNVTHEGLNLSVNFKSLFGTEVINPCCFHEGTYSLIKYKDHLPKKYFSVLKLIDNAYNIDLNKFLNKEIYIRSNHYYTFNDFSKNTIYCRYCDIYHPYSYIFTTDDRDIKFTNVDKLLNYNWLPYSEDSYNICIFELLNLPKNISQPIVYKCSNCFRLYYSNSACSNFNKPKCPGCLYHFKKSITINCETHGYIWTGFKNIQKEVQNCMLCDNPNFETYSLQNNKDVYKYTKLKSLLTKEILVSILKKYYGYGNKDKKIDLAYSDYIQILDGKYFPFQIFHILNIRKIKKYKIKNISSDIKLDDDDLQKIYEKNSQINITFKDFKYYASGGLDFNCFLCKTELDKDYNNKLCHCGINICNSCCLSYVQKKENQLHDDSEIPRYIWIKFQCFKCHYSHPDFTKIFETKFEYKNLYSFVNSKKYILKKCSTCNELMLVKCRVNNSIPIQKPPFKCQKCTPIEITKISTIKLDCKFIDNDYIHIPDYTQNGIISKCYKHKYKKYYYNTMFCKIWPTTTQFMNIDCIFCGYNLGDERKTSCQSCPNCTLKVCYVCHYIYGFFKCKNESLHSSPLEKVKCLRIIDNQLSIDYFKQN